MKISWILIVFCAFTVYAFQCEEKYTGLNISEPEDIKLSVNPEDKKVAVGDTIWLSDNITTQVYDSELQDSIFWEYGSIYVYFYRLKNPVNDQDYNTTPAASEFVFVPENGTIEKEDYSWVANPEKYSYVDNLLRMVTPEISNDSSRYKIRFGIVPQSIGIFAINHAFDVEDFHRELFVPYGDTTAYSFYAKDRNCSSFRASIDERFYFFKVVNE